MAYDTSIGNRTGFKYADPSKIGDAFKNPKDAIPFLSGDGLKSALDPFGLFRKPDFGLEGQSTDLGRFGPNPYGGGLSDMIDKIPGSNYKAKDMSKTALPQYDAMRNRINTQYSQAQDKGQESIDRQFAAMGGGPGRGAQLKQTENLASDVNKQKGSDLESINAQEAEARTGLQKDEANKAFQSSEGGRQLGFSAMGTLGQLNTSWAQAQQDAIDNAFNKQMSQYQAGHSGGLLGGGGFLGLGIGF